MYEDCTRNCQTIWQNIFSKKTVAFRVGRVVVCVYLNGKERHRKKGRFVMALTKAQVREILSKAGVSTENMDVAVGAIIDGHVASVEALREERDRYKAEAEKLPDTKKELENAQKKIAEYDKSAWESKYNDMKAAKEKAEKEFSDFKADTQAKETKANKKSAYRALLKDVGVTENRLDAVLKVTDLDGIELDENGTLKNADELKKNAETEWADFIGKKLEKGAETTKPPENNGGSDMTKEQIMAVKDRNERQRLISENHSLFGY